MDDIRCQAQSTIRTSTAIALDNKLLLICDYTYQWSVAEFTIQRTILRCIILHYCHLFIYIVLAASCCVLG